MGKMEVATYFENGNVAYFKEVTEFMVDQYGLISFKHPGVASQRYKTARFDSNKLVGYTITY